MDNIAVFALLRNRKARLCTLKKELSCLMLQSSTREEPFIGTHCNQKTTLVTTVESLDPYALSDYINMKANVLNENGIQRSASEAALFFRYSTLDHMQLVNSRVSSLRSNIRRGLMMLPGNILVMKAAQSDRRQQIRFGVKSSVGFRPYMEDSHKIKPFFFRIPISLSCTRQLIPKFLESELEKLPHVDESKDACPWSIFNSDVPSSKDIRCVFDEFDLFLVCDGHGGAQVSKYCTSNFKKILRKQLEASVEERYLQLLQSAQKSDHDSMEEKNEIQVERSSRSTSSLRERPVLNKRSRLRSYESARTRRLTEFGSNMRPKDGLTSAQCGLDVEHLGECLSRSFQLIDAEVKKEKLGDNEGSTALAALVGSYHIAVANCGDSRAVLSRNGVAVRLTRDHKPHIAEERSRIEQEGGFVLNTYGCSRVNGFLAMSRAIGDHAIPSVIAQPDVAILYRHPLDEFLICATDGLWDVITDEEACDITRKCLAKAEAKGARKLSSRVAANVLLRAAVDKGSTDNITIAVVDLRMSQDTKNREQA